MNIKTMGFAFIVLSVTFGFAATADTDAQETVQAQSTETAQSTDNDSYDPDEITCKRIAKTGTRFKTKVCATNREWEQSAERAQDTTEKLQRRQQYGRDTG